MLLVSSKSVTIFVILAVLRLNFAFKLNDKLTYVWPLPSEISSGDHILSIDPGLSLVAGGEGGNSSIIKDAFERYKRILFKDGESFSIFQAFRFKRSAYDINELKIVVHSPNEEVSALRFLYFELGLCLLLLYREF